MTHYPGDFATGDTGQWVAHFGHPVELEWSCKQVPTPGKWPIMYFQVRLYTCCDVLLLADCMLVASLGQCDACRALACCTCT